MSQQQFAFTSLSSVTVSFNKLETFIWPHLTTVIQGGKGGNSFVVCVCMKGFTLQSCQLSPSAPYTKILILSCAAPVSQRGGRRLDFSYSAETTAHTEDPFPASMREAVK